jgi:hypothetical protein
MMLDLERERRLLALAGVALGSAGSACGRQLTPDER